MLRDPDQVGTLRPGPRVHQDHRVSRKTGTAPERPDVGDRRPARREGKRRPRRPEPRTFEAEGFLPRHRPPGCQPLGEAQWVDAPDLGLETQRLDHAQALSFVAGLAIGEDPGRLIFEKSGVGSQACHTDLVMAGSQGVEGRSGEHAKLAKSDARGCIPDITREPLAQDCSCR